MLFILTFVAGFWAGVIVAGNSWRKRAIEHGAAVYDATNSSGIESNFKWKDELRKAKK